MTARSFSVGRRSFRAGQHALLACLLLVPLLGACEKRVAPSADDPDLAAYLEVVMPEKLEIQRFLTKPVSFAGDGNADGIELILSAQDASGDPTKVVGTFHIELMARKSHDPLGTRVAFWPVEVKSEKALRMYRDPFSRYYQLPLRLEQGPLAAGEYTLAVWLHAPAGRRLYDAYEFTYEGKGAPPLRP